MLKDLDFADDICLLSSSHKDMQDKINKLTQNANNIGLKINVGKTKLIKKNVNNRNVLRVDSKLVEEVNEFVYLDSRVVENGDITEDINSRLTRANQAFAMLQTIWKSKKLSINMKIRICKSNVLSVLLYGSECWKITKTIENKLNSFQTKCLRRIKKYFGQKP